MTDLPDAVVNAAVEAFARKRNPKHNTLDHSETLAIRAALAAASGPWAEQLDAAKADADGWIFGKEAACRFIARTAWPWEATENRDLWAPRIGTEPEFGRKELALAHRRLDQAAETLGLRDAAIVRGSDDA